MFCPYSISNGALPIERATVEFMASSTCSNRDSHSLYNAPMSCERNTCSMVLCILSVYPSDWGWCTEERRTRVPNNAQRFRHKLAVNLASQSCTTSPGSPNCCTMWVKNIAATSPTLRADSPIVQGMSYTNLDKWSTQVKIALCPEAVKGKAVMKSMLQDMKWDAGMGSGCS